jgi:GNAT superfamily N-acetyltransferase
MRSPRVVQVDLDTVTDTEIAAIHEMRVAAAAFDRPQDPAPQLEHLVIRFRDRGPDRRFVHVVARAGDTIVGHAVLRLSLIDNPHMGMFDLQVHPRHRRQGTGTALLRELLAVMTAEGRPVLLGESFAGTAGDDFAEALGVRMAQAARTSLLRMADVDWPDIEAAAAAKHPGYRLEAFVDHVPDELLEGYARAKTAMNDAPHDDADFGDVAYTPETLRADGARARTLGEPRVVFAVHEDTGEIAGLTEVLVTAAAPLRSYQEDTAVVPAHRGNGLGLWMKADMLVRLRAERPDVTELITGNAASNRHMLAVNDRLGYRLWSEVHGWQVDVPELSARLG